MQSLHGLVNLHFDCQRNFIDTIHDCLELLLGTEAPVMTPSGVDFAFLFTPANVCLPWGTSCCSCWATTAA